jgi:hypothetical protein
MAKTLWAVVFFGVWVLHAGVSMAKETEAPRPWPVSRELAQAMDPTMPDAVPVDPGPVTAPPIQGHEPIRYGDRGSQHVGIGGGFGIISGDAWYSGSAEYNYFIVDRIAPGLKAAISGGEDYLTTGTVAATLRLLPVRTDRVDVFIVPRFGRLFIEDFDDQWGSGLGVGAVLWVSQRVGFQGAWDYLRVLADVCDEDDIDCDRWNFTGGVVLAI